MKQLEKIGFGGGCHWCTEAIFDSLDGVEKVDQGYVASSGENELFSEAVIVHFDSALISLKRLIKIHLETHSSTSSHSFRKKYRSAVYYFTEDQKIMTDQILKELQKIYPEKLITKVLNFSKFKASRESIQKYYKKNPDAPFCKKYILPKLNKISAI